MLSQLSVYDSDCCPVFVTETTTALDVVIVIITYGLVLRASVGGLHGTGDEEGFIYV